jgi:hypothetical protein
LPRLEMQPTEIYSVSRSSVSGHFKVVVDVSRVLLTADVTRGLYVGGDSGVVLLYPAFLVPPKGIACKVRICFVQI